jgi:hypothetical protein
MVSILVEQALGRPHVRLVKDKVHRLAADAPVERLEERQHETALGRLAAELGEIEDRALAHAGDRLTDQRARMRRDREVPVRPPEDGDRKTCALAVRRRAQAPPHAERIRDDRAPLGVQQLLDERARPIGLAGTRRADEAEAIVEGRLRNWIGIAHRSAFIIFSATNWSRYANARPMMICSPSWPAK